MHEGGWEPFVHHFSSVLGDVVPQGSGTWCPKTKEEGIASGEAPRPPGGNGCCAQGRGASRRRNKG